MMAVYGNANHWNVFSGGDIVNPATGGAEKTNPAGFRVYLKTTDGVNANTGAAWGWNLRWCGVGDVKKPVEEQFAMCCGSQKGFSQYGAGLTANIDTSEYRVINVLHT
jgi:hypothetical protein